MINATPLQFNPRQDPPLRLCLTHTFEIITLYHEYKNKDWELEREMQTFYGEINPSTDGRSKHYIFDIAKSHGQIYDSITSTNVLNLNADGNMNYWLQQLGPSLKAEKLHLALKH